MGGRNVFLKGDIKMRNKRKYSKRKKRGKEKIELVSKFVKLAAGGGENLSRICTP